MRKCRLPASADGWLIVTNRDKPLLYNGQIPLFWNRGAAKRHLQPWMIEGNCRVVRATVVVKPPRRSRRRSVSRRLKGSA